MNQSSPLPTLTRPEHPPTLSSLHNPNENHLAQLIIKGKDKKNMVLHLGL